MRLDVWPHIFEHHIDSDEKGSPLKMTAKRYTLGSSKINVDGITLILAHCIGAHKEQWEPSLSRIFEIQQSKPPCHRIREAWAFDWQNHGDAAILNQSALTSKPEAVSIYQWAAAVSAFVRSSRMSGHRIVPVGHSAGAGAMMLTTRGISLPELTYVGLILVEPMMVSEELFYEHFDDMMATMTAVVDATSVRRESWTSREEAFQFFRCKMPWKVWDENVLRCFVEHGLQDTIGGVKLKCDRQQEARSYQDVYGHFEATNELGRVCRRVPIHVIWGSSSQRTPDWLRNSLKDATQGRSVASVKTAHGAGHMVVQEKPDILAMLICDSLDNLAPPSLHRLRSRL